MGSGIPLDSTPPTRGRRRASPCSEGIEFQDRIPVTTRTACAKLLVDDGVRQARAADPVRVNDVEVLVRSANHFRSLDGLLQRLHACDTGCIFEEHHDQMAGIQRGFLAEGIVRDDVLPFLRGTDEEIRLKTEAPLSL